MNANLYKLRWAVSLQICTTITIFNIGLFECVSMIELAIQVRAIGQELSLIKEDEDASNTDPSVI